MALVRIRNPKSRSARSRTAGLLLLAGLAASLLACRLFSPAGTPATPRPGQPNSSSLHITPTPARRSAYTPAARSNPTANGPRPARTSTVRAATPGPTAVAPPEADSPGSTSVPPGGATAVPDNATVLPGARRAAYGGAGGASGIGGGTPGSAATAAAANLTGVISGAGSPAGPGRLAGTPTPFGPGGANSSTTAPYPGILTPSGFATPAPSPDIFSVSPTAPGYTLPTALVGTPSPTLTPAPTLAPAAQGGASATRTPFGRSDCDPADPHSCAPARRLSGTCRTVLASGDIQKLLELSEAGIDKRRSNCDW